MCSPSLSWLYPWSQVMASTVHQQLSLVKCRVENSHQMPPILEVMEYYTSKVNPFCPGMCDCYFHHFASTPADLPSFTVLVNCSYQGLSTFPTVPPRTTVLDVSHNQIQSFYSLTPVTQNYQHISSLILSHNLLTTIDTKLLKLKLDRSFKADHNAITEIPYDFSLLLQKYAKNEVFLGNNPWACSCNAEITNLVSHLLLLRFYLTPAVFVQNLKMKVVDIEEVICDEGSFPQPIIGKKV